MTELTRVHGWRLWVPLVVLWVVWGSTFLGVSESVATMPPLLSAGARYLIAGVMLLLGLQVAGPRALRDVTREQLQATVIIGLGTVGIWGASSSSSQRYIPGGVAAIIAASVPLWVVIFRRISGDLPSRATLLGVVVGLVALGAMMLPGAVTGVGGADRGTVALWSLIMLVGSAGWAFFSWRASRMDLPSNPLVGAALSLTWAGLGLTLGGGLIGERVQFDEVSVASWLGWSWLIVASLVGYVAFTTLISRAPLSLVSTYAYVNPVVAVFLGWLVLSEPLTWPVIIGLLVVAGSVAMVVSGERSS
ncbi:MAG: EamA family transporter [Actinomycetales bacterium]